MPHILLVIDMQNDFITGPLGTHEAQVIVHYVADVIRRWEGPVFFTKDTHTAQYLDTQEGQILPVTHCVKGTEGWEIPAVLVDAAQQSRCIHRVENQHAETINSNHTEMTNCRHTETTNNGDAHMTVIEKPCFGSLDLVRQLQELHSEEPIDSITMVGLCTDICVVSNALLVKAGLPEVPLYIDAAGCAGVTPEKHKAALETMRSCQCHVINA